MAFGGYQTTTGDFLPICKYDARSGKFFKMNKRADGGSDAVELPLGTKFALDLGSFEVGYVMFGPQGPVRRMAPYTRASTPLPRPEDKDAEGKYIFRPGFYAKIVGMSVDGVREWCSNAAVLLNAMDELYERVINTPEVTAGKIPLISIVSTTAVKSGQGAKSSTNYAPVFQVEGYVDRPDILGPRTVPLTNGHAGYTQAPVQPAAATIATMTPAQTATMAQASVPSSAAAPEVMPF